MKHYNNLFNCIKIPLHYSIGLQKYCILDILYSFNRTDWQSLEWINAACIKHFLHTTCSGEVGNAHNDILTKSLVTLYESSQTDDWRIPGFIFDGVRNFERTGLLTPTLKRTIQDSKVLKVLFYYTSLIYWIYWDRPQFKQADGDGVSWVPYLALHPAVLESDNFYLEK